MIEPVLTAISEKILATRYLIRNEKQEVIETPKALFQRVASFIAGAESTPHDYDKWNAIFYRLMASCEFEPNTPCLVNAGRPDGTGQLSACFVIPVPDSMDGIFTAMRHMALVQKTGGGTGFSFSRLRPEGDFVASTSGIASGPISFMEVFDFSTERIKQGGVRRGANMGILRVDHPDIIRFIRLKQDPKRMQNFNVSVAITDAFMLALEAGKDYDLIHPVTGHVVGQLNAPAVWREIVQCAHAIGDPGLWFIDRTNAADPLSASLGPIEATNPCVPAGTRILTDRGWEEIQTIVSQAVRVWNGEQWSTVTPAVTGHNQPIVKVALSDGHVLRCTPKHMFYLADGTKIEARDLRPGDSLEKLGFTPPTEGNSRFANEQVAYLAGFYQGDGYRNTEKGQQEINFYGKAKIDIAGFFADAKLLRAQPYSESQDRVRGVLNVGVPEKGVVPVNVEIRQALAWLAGLLDADGNVVMNGTSSYGYQISSIDRSFLADVQLLLRRLGVPSVLALMKDAETKVMPGGEYHCQPCWRVTIAASAARRLQEMGLQPRRLDATDNNPSREALRFPRVVSVEPDGVADVVYCFTEPQRHRGVFDGVLTGQCGEVPLRPFDACCLGSVNLAKFYVEKDTSNTKAGNVMLRHGTIDFNRLQRTVQHSVRFLDNMLTVNKYPIPEIADVTSKSRKIGLGVMGWADLLIQLGLPYGSPEARELGAHVMKLVDTWAVDASEQLAEERQPFHHWPQSKWAERGDKPRRHATVTVIAPTGTISMIAGCSSGIEPSFALSMTREQAGLTMLEVNPLVEKIAKREGFWSDDLADCVRRTGSLKDAPGVPDHWRAVFAIANELDAEAHIGMQAAFQQHTEDAVSKTINLHREATPEDVERAYMLAWTKGCKGITVYRDGCRDGQVLTAGTAPVETAQTMTEAEAQVVLQTAIEAVERRAGTAIVPAVKRRVPNDGRRDGVTLSKSTPYGTVHMTVNNHPDDGDPFELFVRVGKSGSEVMAWAEAFGRVVSYTLALPSPFSPKVRLEEVARQLASIGGGDVWNIGMERVVSAPDAISKLLLSHLGVGDGPHYQAPTVTVSSSESMPFPVGAPAAMSFGTNVRAKSRSLSDLCPSCGKATFTYQQRCGLCTSCGHSKC